MQDRNTDNQYGQIQRRNDDQLHQKEMSEMDLMRERQQKYSNDLASQIKEQNYMKRMEGMMTDQERIINHKRLETYQNSAVSQDSRYETKSDSLNLSEAKKYDNMGWRPRHFPFGVKLNSRIQPKEKLGRGKTSPAFPDITSSNYNGLNMCSDMAGGSRQHNMSYL